jgi:hypothetical protein
MVFLASNTTSGLELRQTKVAQHRWNRFVHDQLRDTTQETCFEALPNVAAWCFLCRHLRH